IPEGVINFGLDNLFMREIDTVKQENSELFRFIEKDYVKVNDSPHYKEDGLKSIRKGDYMEYPKIAKEFN
ncbi:9520_t:CDS:2, partial [Funneliformis geosporum]